MNTVKITTFPTISLYLRWFAAFCILIGFAFFDLGKSENSSYFAIVYLLLTAPEIIRKISFAMGHVNENKKLMGLICMIAPALILFFVIKIFFGEV